MLPEIKQAFLDAFAEFPDINFIWKYEIDDNVGDNLKNLYKGKWHPQPDILEHPKLLAFISHGGMNSIIEASTRGVAMLCVPIFADQVHNAYLLGKRGTAISLNKLELTKEKIVEAINEIVSNNVYRENAKKLAKVVKAKPTTPDERIVQYVKFAVDIGDTQPFQTAGRYMNNFQLYSLDVLAAYAVLFSLIVIFSYLTLRWIVKNLKKLFCSSCKSTDNKKKTQ